MKFTTSTKTREGEHVTPINSKQTKSHLSCTNKKRELFSAQAWKSVSASSYFTLRWPYSVNIQNLTKSWCGNTVMLVWLLLRKEKGYLSGWRRRTGAHQEVQGGWQGGWQESASLTPQRVKALSGLGAL